MAKATTPKEEANGGLVAKVSDKGGISVYGLGGRFPVTLYVDQWELLIANADKIQRFIDQNRSRLKVKPEGSAVVGGTRL